ncbi:MAG: LuxR C-terminal-related transcriptional regulator [Myxococcota bacterium]
MRSPAAEVEPRTLRVLTLVLGVIAVGGAIDLVLDRPATLWSFHVAFELAMISFALGASLWLWQSWRRAEVSLADAERSLAERRAERDRWRERARSVLRGLGEEIDAQLRRWSLTPAERDTALLVLKGYTHGEIARLLGKSERTVRQQAAAVYRKAGVSSRTEFSAFFLEDLLLPSADLEVRDPAARDG